MHSPSQQAIDGNSQTELSIYETQAMIMEVSADETELAMGHARGEGDVADFFRDLRALRTSIDPHHASSILTGEREILGDDAVVTDSHFQAASGITSAMDRYAAKAHTDFSGNWNEVMRVEENMSELKNLEPHKYFELVRKGIEHEINKINPGSESDATLGQLNELTIEQEYIKSYEDAYRRRILGEDIPMNAHAHQNKAEPVKVETYDHAVSRLETSGVQNEQALMMVTNADNAATMIPDGVEPENVIVADANGQTRKLSELAQQTPDLPPGQPQQYMDNTTSLSQP